MPLEKHADVLIADHLRKDTPQGALSYEYIDACIKKGRLVNKEDHPAGRSQDTARPVGSSEPAKATRTPFTAEDDKILTKWVLDAARGGSARGNKIYEELAAIVGATPPPEDNVLADLIPRRIPDTLLSPGGTAGSRNSPISQNPSWMIVRCRMSNRRRPRLRNEAVAGQCRCQSKPRRRRR